MVIFLSPQERVTKSFKSIVKLIAWQELSPDVVCDSFSCGLTNVVDGSEDADIPYFIEGRPCISGREMLAKHRDP